MRLYETLVEDLTRLVTSGVLRPGDRVPSVRELTRSRSVSPGTVLQAYGVLEDQGLIEARPRSGYYVSVRGPGPLPTPETRKPSGRPGTVEVGELIFEVLSTTRDRSVLPFGSAFPSPELFPFRQLSQAFGAAARFLDPWKTVSNLSPGNQELRRLIARRYLELGCTVKPDEIFITCGAMEALNLCLQSVARPGDLVAIESPAFYACLQIVEALGLRAVEVATEPMRGVDLAALEQVVKRHRIKACWFMTTFQNPLGSLMPPEKKRDLVELLARHEIPLIEDDVYAELYLKGTQPKPAKAFDRAGLVMHCSSFSKCLAPGFRVGWVVPGRFAERVHKRQFSNTLTPSVPSQLAIVEYLKHGGYERHLRQLRKALSTQQRDLLEAVRRYFPAGTKVTQPDGGYFAWVELPERADSVRIYREAMKANISVSPGPMFSAQRGYRNYLRLNYGHPWSSAMEQGIRTLARLSSPRG